MEKPTLVYKTTIELRHDGECGLMGVTPDLMIYAEEYYTADSWICQHRLTLDGIVESIDEDYGRVREITPLELPAESARTQPGWHTKNLNFSGARHRGMRETERIGDVVRELTLSEKMLVAERFNLPVSPPMILGLAESYVFSEAALIYPRWFVVCRRLRVAYALAEVRHDEHQQPYDYESRVLHLAHLYDKSALRERTLSEILDNLPDATLYRPTDCIAAFGHLIIADSGGTSRKNRVHVWQIELPPSTDDATQE